MELCEFLCKNSNRQTFQVDQVTENPLHGAGKLLA